MIKKISQLNRLPAEFYKDNDGNTTKDGWNTLFEVSFETNPPTTPANADDVNYYTSYSTTLSGLENMLELDTAKETLSNLLDGGLTAVIGDFIVGTRGDEAYTDRIGCSYFPDKSNLLTIYSGTNFQNDFTMHGCAEFHNNVVLKCTDAGKTDPVSSLLSVEGVATFDQLINGTAFRARWADLAEIYSADADYEPGTLVKFGGEEEITIAKGKANAVVTTNPALILNGDAPGYKFPVGIALVGKVPIKVRGPVRKFDKIVLSRTDPGIGVVYNFAPNVEVIGRAMEENSNPDEKLVLCATNFNIL